MDTVFDAGTVAKRPFRIDGNIATGPGVTDMKSGLLAGLYALEAIGELPFERLTFIANPDEEVASPTSTPHIRAAAGDADVALVLECGRANGNIVSARKGIADLEVVVHGRAAHAGIEPEKGRHAILEGARLVRDLQELNGRWPGVTFNVGTIRGGTRPNVIPERCRLEVEVRSVTSAGLDIAIDAVRDAASRTSVEETTVDVDVEYMWRPMEKTEHTARLAEHAKDVGRRLGIMFDDQLTGGASDANTTSGMGVPTLDGLGPVGGNDHSPSEYLEVDTIVPRTAMLAGLLLEIAADPVVLDWRESATARAGR
jgi:glutamate carboxypeptidase